MRASAEADVIVGCLQFEPVIGAVSENIAQGVERLEEAASAGVRLAVLPELCDSGYVFGTRNEAFGLAATAEKAPALQAFAKVAARHGMHIVTGFCERDGDALYNSAAMIGPEGLIGVYRKTHLWAAEALFFEPGNRGFPVFQTPLGRIAPLICYDGWFPEAWRRCALSGADIVCVPTNWVPMPSQPSTHPAMANVLCMAAAHANGIFVAAACRIGTERGQPFIGQSLIVGPDGWLLAGPAPANSPALLSAPCNLAAARRGRTLNEFNHLLRDRRDDVYGDLCARPPP